MKIAFTGKGGVGKTTAASLLIRSLAKDRRRVLAVDCDPDPNLAAALGFPNALEIAPISRMKDMIYERMEIKDNNPVIYKMNPKIDDIPAKFIKKKDSIELIAMGTVEKGGAGCVCPESVFLRDLLGQIVLGEREDIVMDMDPGVEHLGRRTAKSVDAFIVVVEPSINSVETAKKIQKLSRDIGVRDIFIVGNKVRNSKDKVFIQSSFDKDAVLGIIPESDTILEMDKTTDKTIKDNKIIDEVERVKNVLYAKEKKHAGK